MSSYVYQVTGSYPFMQIAKKYGLDLETVYCYADFSRNWMLNRWWMPTNDYWFICASQRASKKLGGMDYTNFQNEIAAATMDWAKKQGWAN